MVESKPSRPLEGNELKIPTDGNKGKVYKPNKYRGKKQPQNKSSLEPETGPGRRSRFLAPGLIYFEVVSYLCTYWAWRLVPCSRQLGYSIHYLQVGGMALIRPLPRLFSIFLVLILNSQLVCRYSYGLEKTVIYINTLLSSLLDI